MLSKKLLYILQSLNYKIKPFLKYAYTHPAWWNFEKRSKLKWTLKSRLLYSLSLLLVFISLIILTFFWKIIGFIIFLLSLILLPFYLILANILLKPADYFFKKLIINKAKKILSALNIKVIGITGSFGKTSCKEILAGILSEKFQVLTTPENINTDIGIAELIIKQKNELAKTEIFIVEMGAYRRGEIAKICNLVKPDYSILTGINEAHLEKFGSLYNTIKAKFELPVNTKNFSFLNFSDINVISNYQKFPLKNFIGVARENRIKNINYLENFNGLEFVYDNHKFFTKLLAEHNIDLILLAGELAKKLSVNYEQIIAGVKKVNPVKHRLELIYNSSTNIYIIDDSYNGNFNGIISGLGVLNRAKGRKIVLTPGLVEQGEKSRKIHNKIGELYAKSVDLVLLINNTSTQHILKSLKNKNFSNYKIYDSAQAAHADLKNVLQSGDTIIFQNDWPDAYY